MPSNRKLPNDLELTRYVSGYLSDTALSGASNKYGYSKNHIPQTSGKGRMVVSSFDLACETKPDEAASK